MEEGSDNVSVSIVSPRRFMWSLSRLAPPARVVTPDLKFYTFWWKSAMLYILLLEVLSLGYLLLLLESFLILSYRKDLL